MVISVEGIRGNKTLEYGYSPPHPSRSSLSSLAIHSTALPPSLCSTLPSLPQSPLSLPSFAHTSLWSSPLPPSAPLTPLPSLNHPSPSLLPSFPPTSICYTPLPPSASLPSLLSLLPPPLVHSLHSTPSITPLPPFFPSTSSSPLPSFHSSPSTTSLSVPLPPLHHSITRLLVY